MSGVLLARPEDRLHARRQAVASARLALAHAPAVHYTQGPDRWQGIAHELRAIRGKYPTQADCSAFVSWCLWDATRPWHLPDFANSENWTGGFTGTLCEHGTLVTNGHYLLADVALYGRGAPFKHTALLAGMVHGVPHVISHGSEEGPYFLPLNYRQHVDGAPPVVRRLIR